MLFCLLLLITEIFSIRLTVAIENTSVFSLESGETGDIIKQDCNKTANCRSKNFYQGILYRLNLVFHNSNPKRHLVRYYVKKTGE